MKAILYIATLVSLITYMFWEIMPKGCFYLGNAIFIFLLCLYIFLKNRKLFITFFLLGLAINNLFDELLFNPTKLEANEIATLITLPIIWFIKSRYDKQRTTN